jgi:hypothetical protein
MDAWVWGIGAAIALQGLQTIQIAIVGRRVDTVARSLAPPPSMPRHPRCNACGLPYLRSELDAGICADCRRVGGGGTTSVS